MGISGIGSYGEYGGLFNYYRVNDIPVVDVESVKNSEMNADLMESEQSTYETQDRIDTRSRIANLEDVSISLNKTDYDYIGKDASIGTLDMDSILSDAKKDSILDDYSYFVTPGMLGTNEDGSVFLKE